MPKPESGLERRRSLDAVALRGRRCPPVGTDQGGDHCAVDRDAALESARATDRAIAPGRDPGILGGVPLAHKDMFYRKGRVTGCGSLIRRDFVPDVTAAVLERLDRAGAVDLARLHMAEFEMG